MKPGRLLFSICVLTVASGFGGMVGCNQNKPPRDLPMSASTEDEAAMDEELENMELPDP